MKKIAAVLAMSVSLVFSGCSSTSSNDKTITVGSKNFTESILLGEIYAQALEANGYKVTRKMNLGGTMIAHEALKKGDIDMYPEYTGTGLLAVLKEPTMTDANQVYEKVKSEYEKQFNLLWLKPTQVNDSQALVIRKEDSESAGIKTLSDLSTKAGEYKMAALADFADREDGLKGLQKTYGGFQFKDIKVYDNGIKYQVLDKKDADVTIGFTTDAVLATGKYVVLEDDKGLWPPYYVAPVIRPDKKDAEATLNLVSALLTTEKMQQLNAKVDIDKKEPADVAKEFLKNEGVIK